MSSPETDPSSKAERSIRAVLSGEKRGFRAFLPFFGPAVIASIAYMDPGNFATNIQAGAKYGYALLWVLLGANLVAMLFQALSAKLGIVTGQNLAEMCRENYNKPAVIAMWIVSEIAAMATDLAEFLGGAIGLALLLDMPLIAGMAVTAIITYMILLMESQGYRRMEILISAFVAIIGLCYAIEIFLAPVDWSGVAMGMVTPDIPDRAALVIVVGIIGATIMPHAVFLHSSLTQARGNPRNKREKRMLVRFSNREVLIALAFAGLVNMAMVIMAAAAFHQGHSEVAEIETAYHMLTPLLGGAASAVFLISLIASGIASSVVGTMAGQMIMQGFVGFRIPLLIRRLVTMLPAFAVVAWGVNATDALVYSQVILSLALPIPMLALLHFTSRRDIMGEFVNARLTTVIASVGAVVVLVLNFMLLGDALGLF
ncbi:MAG: Nramp family divalent metal transporter [Alphaproteobacteria bacterium]